MSDATPEDSQGPFDFVAAVEAGKADVLEACVACGKCFEVCPTVANAGLAEANPESTTAAVLDILTGGQGTKAAVTFANTCMGSGFCIDACDYGVNPRFMLTLARRELDRRDDRERRKAGIAGFRKVAEGARTLSRLVATEAERARLSGRTGPADGSPEVVFYTGCNVWKTPHIVMLCLDVLERLETRATVMGGPDHCCGVLHWRAGDTATAGRFAGASIDRFSEAGAERVLTWCPTCQVQFSEINLPAHARVDAGRNLAMEPFLPWLAARLDHLAPHFVHPVRRRVGLHEHPGVGGVTEAALAILDAIPGLEIVDLEQPRDGWMCNTLATLPDYKQRSHAALLEAAAAAGVDTLTGVYHACHRDLCAHETEWPFEVVNLMDLVGEAMGIVHEDRFKQLKGLGDTDAVMAELAPEIGRAGLSEADVRRVVERDILGEQPLPLGGGPQRR